MATCRSVYALLTATVEGLNTVGQYDDSLNEMAKNLQDMLYVAEDYGLTLSGYSSKMDYDTERRDRMNERKYTLDKAKRKYNLSIEELIAEQQRLAQEVNQLDKADEELEALEQLCAQKRKEYDVFALQVREQRQQLAQQLTDGLLEQLAQLAMSNTRFAVQF